MLVIIALDLNLIFTELTAKLRECLGCLTVCTNCLECHALCKSVAIFAVLDKEADRNGLCSLGHILILFCPIEVFCLIPNLNFWVKDIKQNSRKQNIVKLAYVCAFFIILCLVKIVLYFYGNTLVGVV